MIRLFITVEDITSVMDAGYTVIRVYTDTSESGDFTTLDGTETLVAATESYEYIDTDGTTDTWYKTAYYGAVPGLGTKSTARKGGTAAAYATVKELRAFAGIDSTGDDVELAQLLDGAARSINRWCNRSDGFFAVQTATARYYPGSGRTYQLIDECVAITTVAVKDSATDTDYTDWDTPTTMYAGDGDWLPFAGDPQSPLFDRVPYTAIMTDLNGDYSTFTSGLCTTRRGFRPTSTVKRAVPTVKVTARWGYADAVLDDIRVANLIEATRWYKRLQSGASDTLASSELGQLMYTKKLDPDAEAILIGGRYVRPAIGRRR